MTNLNEQWAKTERHVSYCEPEWSEARGGFLYGASYDDGAVSLSFKSLALAADDNEGQVFRRLAMTYFGYYLRQPANA